MNENDKYLQYKGLIFLAIKKKHVYYKTEDEFQEYIDAGTDGLIKGIRTFDKTKNVKESTYVYKCIETEIKKRIYLNTMQKRKGETVSLNQLIGNNNDFEELIDFIPSEVDIEKEVEDKLVGERLVEIIETLPIEKDIEVIKYCYGLDNHKQMNCSQIARLWGVNKNAIISRKNRALGLLWKKVKEDELCK